MGAKGAAGEAARGAEAHVGAGETQERGVPADEGKEEQKLCWSRRDTRERSSSR